ncbi:MULTISPECIES: hypothetical protein [Pandoraea]|uniref:Uncharacterized protein n=2 Tax=Pandoraea TaxID=93217 RepID=A0A5E4XD21_9BURK|nr:MULTISPECIES: hypothetical protein [Pandoraea]VVE16353.1 hypothetical protein PCE31107_02912 [Pandoraea cepalis]VVE34050.1 hypothetical protein PTE31013_03827 [Pandoraea terrigena]
MSRNWESVYANLGDVTDCLREAVRTLRKEVQHAVPGTARGTPAVDVKANLEQRIALIQEAIKLVEQDRSDFYVSHTPEVRSAWPQPNFLFGVPSVEA